MSGIYILAGEELFLKDMRVQEINKELGPFDFKSIHSDSINSSITKSQLEEAELFLNMQDFFFSKKAIRLSVYKNEHCLSVISSIRNISQDNLLIIDLRSTEKVSDDIKKLSLEKNIIIEEFRNFKEYKKKNAINFAKKHVSKYNISFKNKEEEEMSILYIVDNSRYSYGEVYKNILALKNVGESEYSYDRVKDIVKHEFHGNLFKICDDIFSITSKMELNEYLDFNVSKLKNTELSSLINIFISKIKDYILYKNGHRCKIGANFYTFQSSKIEFTRIEEFIVSLRNLSTLIKFHEYNGYEDFVFIFLTHINAIDA